VQLLDMNGRARLLRTVLEAQQAQKEQVLHKPCCTAVVTSPHV
jgi:hypothetical protein